MAIPILVDVKIKGANRVIARLNKIIANIDPEIDGGSEQLMKVGQKIARQEIRSQTDGTGALAAGIIIKKTKFKDGRKTITRWNLDVNDAVKKYAKFVHDGFSSHWVHRDMIADWLVRHPDVRLKGGKWLEVGYPKMGTRSDGSGKSSAPWLMKGGVKYFDKAYAEILKLSPQEYQNRLQKIVRGK